MSHNNLLHENNAHAMTAYYTQGQQCLRYHLLRSRVQVDAVMKSCILSKTLLTKLSSPSQSKRYDSSTSIILVLTFLYDPQDLLQIPPITRKLGRNSSFPRVTVMRWALFHSVIGHNQVGNKSWCLPFPSDLSAFPRSLPVQNTS